MANKYYLILFCIIQGNCTDLVAGGMFSLMSQVLINLRQSEKEKTDMQVIWGQEYLYYQTEGYHGFYNVWEYYFYPIPARTSEPIDDTNITHYAGQCIQLMEHYNYRCLYHELIKRYIHLKPHVQDRIDNWYNKHMKNKKVIGVHLRSESKDVEGAPIPLGDIFNKLEEYKDYIFFIASDSTDFIDKAYKRFPNKCITLDKLNDPLLYRYNILGSPAKAGEDVIVDTYLLSKCEKIIMNHVSSNVVMYALYLNLDLEPIVLL